MILPLSDFLNTWGPCISPNHGTIDPMDVMDPFERICSAMLNPEFYPHGVRGVERRDTHISAVFLTGDWVYKLKKPVNFGFLDFRSLESRERFCRQEVLLNQRLSHGVYDSVVEIRQEASGRYFLNGVGEVVEFAVRMKELPDRACLQSMILSPEQVDSAPDAWLEQQMLALGQRLARFYGQSERSPAIDQYGLPQRVSFNMEENFEQIDPFVVDLVPREHWEFIREVSRAFFRDHETLLLRRVAEGRICDGHGDLRTDHIYLVDGIQIIDCIEFNERFRYGDAALDLAFLHMDFDHLGRQDLSLQVLDAYVKQATDPGIFALLDFYAAYRAIVKLKVSCLHFSELHNPEGCTSLRRQAVAYLQQAYRYAIQFSRPTLWVCLGLPATGKSSLAGGLGAVFSMKVFQTDRIRKEQEGVELLEERVVPYDSGMYKRERRHRVYASMMVLAMEELKHGRSVVLDGSFSQRKWREQVQLLAEDLDANLIFVFCSCDEAVIRCRLQARQGTANVSDARLEHLPRMMEEFEALDEISTDRLIRVNTNEIPDDTLRHVVSEGYGLKGIQVKNLMESRL
jgi:uncharacterized protein